MSFEVLKLTFGDSENDVVREWLNCLDLESEFNECVTITACTHTVISGLYFYAETEKICSVNSCVFWINNVLKEANNITGSVCT